MSEILLRPVLALLLPLSMFAALYLACRKENAAIDVDTRYRLALVGSLTFLFWVMFSPSSRNFEARLGIDLLETASIACAWGLAVTGWRLGVKKPSAAIALTILTTVSLACWGKIWSDRFITHF